MNEMLTKIQQDIAAKVTPANKNAFDKCNIAVDKMMFDPKTHSKLSMVKEPELVRQDLVGTISKGVAGLMWLLFVQSKKTMEEEVLILSGIIAATKALDFAERGLGIPITADQIADTVKAGMEIMFVKMGITPEQLNKAVADGKKEIDDYQKHQSFIGDKITQTRKKGK